MRRIARALKYLSIAIAAHGLLLAVFAFAIAPHIGDDAPEPLASLGFYLIVVPAMLLAKPLNPILWKLGLIQAPGWFTWPKPLGFVLVYVVWVVGLLVLSLLGKRRGGSDSL